MMKRLMYGLLSVGLCGACGGDATTDNGTPPDPQLTLLTPSTAFVGRVVDFQVAASDTQFDATTLVSLGDPGITVSNVEIGDRENLRFTATLAPTALLGAHDLTISKAGTAIKLTGGLDVQAPLQAEPPPAGSTAQPAPQGGITTIYTRNLDYVLNPFAPSAVSTRFALNVSSLQGAILVNGARYAAVGLVDALVPAGMALKPQVSSLNPFLQPTVYVADGADANLPKVTQRAATAVSSGTALAGQLFANPNDSGFYTLLTNQDNQVLLAQFSALGTMLASTNGMQGAVAPPSGKYGDGGFGSVTYNSAGTQGSLIGLLGVAGPQYFSIWPTGFGGGTAAQYGYSVTPRLLPGTRFNTAETTPDTTASPIANLGSVDANTGHYATDGSFDRPGDVDYILYSPTTAANRVFITVNAPGASVSVSEYATATCTGATTSASGFQWASIELVTNPGVRCITVTANNNTPRYPTPYKIVVAAQ